MKEEYYKDLGMSYMDLCKYLQKKYGLATCDYFATPECKSKSKKVTRTSEGLFCHHIFEDRYDNLGEPHMARIQPFEAQKKENLAYCNYIEHLILHLKINANARFIFEEAFEVKYFFNSIGFIWIAGDINCLYKNGGSSQKWRNNCFHAINDEYEDYVNILRAALCFIDKNFRGDKKRIIAEGDELAIDIMDFDSKADLSELRGHQYKYKRINPIVLKIDKTKDIVFLKTVDYQFEGKELFTLKMLTPGFLGGSRKDSTVIAYKYSELLKLYDYESIIHEKKNEMSYIGEEGIWKELREQLDFSYTEEDIKNAICIEKSLG